MPLKKELVETNQPTLREIAQRAGLTTSAVSMALRNHPRISAATRKRVGKIASAIGYRPDPQVAKLMSHLRQRNKTRFKSVIVALTSIPETEERPYNLMLRRGAEERAKALGYKLEVMRINPSPVRNKALQRILLTRGVEGVLLLPMRDSIPLTDMLDWSLFSVVAATRGVPSPAFHRVLPNHFFNSVLLCDRLEKIGFQRIGLATNRGFDLLTSPGLAAGVVWQPVQGRAEYVEPLLWDSERPEGVQGWAERERPDAIIVRGVPDAEAVTKELRLKFPGPVGIAVSNLEGVSGYAGIDVRAYEIGVAAIDQLNGRFQSNEKGIPKVPTETTIMGQWVAEKSALLAKAMPAPARR